MHVCAETLICRIDQLMATQLDVVLHHAALQQLESAWRGLYLLATQIPAQQACRLRVLDIRISEIQRDVESVLDIEHSELFHKIHDEEFDRAGGEPFGILLGNYYFDPRQPATARLLHMLGRIAAAAFSPLVCAVAPAFFATDDFAQIAELSALEPAPQAANGRFFESLCEDENSRFLTLVLPRILLRQPWQHAGSASRMLYREHWRSNSDLLWGNAVFALGTVLIREFAECGWFTQIRGAPRATAAGGVVTTLEPMDADDDDFSFAPLPTVDAIITDRRERELANLGLASLCHCWNTRYSAFHSLPTLYRPTAMHNDKTSINVAAHLQNILCGCRFAHYIKSILRDKTGSLASAQDCEQLVANWLQQYAINSNDASWQAQAKYPLRSFRVDIRQNTTRPENFLCSIWLTPHYQIDGITSEIRLSTEANIRELAHA